MPFGLYPFFTCFEATSCVIDNREMETVSQTG